MKVRFYSNQRPEALLNSFIQQPLTNGIRTHVRLHRGWFISWLIVLSALAGTMTQLGGNEGMLPVLLRSFSANKVLWLCLGIAIWHLLQLRSAQLDWLDLLASMPAVVASLVFPGSLAWVGLLISLILLSKLTRFGIGRAGFWIAIASCYQVLGTDILSQLGGDGILKFEAQLVGFVAQPIVSELTVYGSALLGADGHTLVLVWGCSAFSNLGFSLLLFLTLLSLRFSEDRINRQKLLLVGYLLIASMAVIAINLVRLSLMMVGPEFFQYMHAGDGAGLVRVTTLGCITLLGLKVPFYEKAS